MGLFLAAAILVIGVILLLIRPFWTEGRISAAPTDYNITVYKDQLSELARDVERGLISKDEAEAAKAEIARRLIAEERSRKAAGGARANPKRDQYVVWALIAIVPIAAGAIYLQLGSPAMPGHPFSGRAQESAARVEPQEGMHPGMTKLVEQLEAKLKENPDDAEGWALYARTMASLDRHPDAQRGYARAVELTQGGDIQLVGDLAEMNVVVGGGNIDVNTVGLFQKVLAERPDDVRAQYYMALAKAQIGDTAGALEGWKKIVRESPPDAPWVPMVRQQIAGIEPDAPEAKAPDNGPAPITPAGVQRGPTADEVAAASQMTPEEQSAMIEGMVARLATRLEENPDNLAGWMQLARSYMVLGKVEEAKKAFNQVLRLDPGNQLAKQGLAELGGN